VSPSGGISFTDDGRLGGQFSYDATDGTATSAPGTVMFDNNDADLSPNFHPAMIRVPG
jgi:hypothetical protein